MALNLCSSNHEEICYEGPWCPVCVLKDDLKNQIAELSKENMALEKEVDNLSTS